MKLISTIIKWIIALYSAPTSITKIKEDVEAIKLNTLMPDRNCPACHKPELTLVASRGVNHTIGIFVCRSCKQVNEKNINFRVTMLTPEHRDIVNHLIDNKYNFANVHFRTDQKF
jgi:transposase-like protein